MTAPDTRPQLQSLQASAALACVPQAAMPQARAVSNGSLAQPSAALGRAVPPQSCAQTLQLSFFFDGTGNNLDADENTWEHSNVARLYRAHLADDDAQGIYRFYLPGIGTLFRDREVNDPGGTITGNAFGAQGQDRIDWALARLTEKVAAAKARAQNPSNPILWVKVSAFGFSRGAALARAFCREVQKRCRADGKSGTGWRWSDGGAPIEICFLGIFDTVASTNLPPAANNIARNAVLKWVGDRFTRPELEALAFGDQPGADPASGLVNGHGAWAGDLRIVAMVKRCVHFVAAHEQRNSFALDSILETQSDGTLRSPPNSIEVVYPGVHSDVGGGYRPGEGGTRPERGAQLSLLPLRVMFDEAKDIVPLRPLHAMVDKAQREDFAVTPETSQAYSTVVRLFGKVQVKAMNTPLPWAQTGIGADYNRHMGLYFAWRFHVIRRGAYSTAGQTQRRQVEQNEAGFARDRARLAKERQQTYAALTEAQRDAERVRLKMVHAKDYNRRYGTPIDPQLVAEEEAANRRLLARQTEDDRVRAKQDGAADDSSLQERADAVDAQLLEHAKELDAWMNERSRPLRPHYAVLLAAYRNEYSGRGLRAVEDADVIEFFDEYVHDSLAGFDKDWSWRSDPRVIYVGGNHKLRFAQAPLEEGQQAA